MVERGLRTAGWWIAALAWMVLIFWLSSQSDIGGGDSIPDWLPADKLGHLFLYAVLGGLFVAASGRPSLAVLLAAGYGVSDELHQLAVPGRHADPLDWLADLLGATLGAFLVAFLTGAGRARREPIE